MKVRFYTLGCKVNTCESEEISENLKKHGYETVTDLAADAAIVNSCAVTGESGRKTRQTLRRARRENPDAVILLTGCLPQAFPDAADALPEADIIIGNKSNGDIPALLAEFRRTGARICRTAPHERGEGFSGAPVDGTLHHTRAFLKIQDGCNRFCSYCIIPYARGRSRSRSLAEIRDCSARFAENGYRETVLVGIDLTDYGVDLDGVTLADAVSAAAEPDGIRRVRLGSLEPHNLTDAAIQRLAACDKLCPQFHVSLQSGSDGVLKRMNRRYTADAYAHVAALLRASFPDCAITTDIICGFPGETDAEFAETVAFVKKMQFEKTHIFPFSAREGTRAAAMEGQLPGAVKNERCAYLAQICEQIRRTRMENAVGRVYEVLFESPSKGYMHGYAPNYTPVFVQTAKNVAGRILPVRITGVSNVGCVGQLCE